MVQNVVRVDDEIAKEIDVSRVLYLAYLDEDQGSSIEEMEENSKKDSDQVKVVRYITFEAVEEISDIGSIVENSRD